MKKILIAFAAVITSCFMAFADTSLESAYEQLSRLPGMSEQNVGKIKIGDNTAIRNVKTATVNVAQGDIQAYRDKFVWMTENLPIKNMVIGANNRRELAAVYATPTAGGDYTVLIFKGDAINGNFSVSYGQTTPAGIAEINSANVEMDNGELVMTADASQNSFIRVAAF